MRSILGIFFINEEDFEGVKQKKASRDNLSTGLIC
jgi:hypothetical protein